MRRAQRAGEPPKTCEEEPRAPTTRATARPTAPPTTPPTTARHAPASLRLRFDADACTVSPSHSLLPSCPPTSPQVCLPPVESCADKTKPPCDAHLDLNTAAMADNLNYKNHFGWIDRGDFYRTTQ